MNLTMVLGLGLLLGMQHATEADHLAAVAALAGRGRSLRQGLSHGVAWGLGHTLVLLLVAIAAVLPGWVMPARVASHLEQAVGAMLLLLGIGVVLRLRRERMQPHAAAHPLPWRSAAVGMVHGLAGSAALALLASRSMPGPGWMLLYVLVFGLGSIAGMALLSGALAIPLGLTARRLDRAYGALNLGVALFSVGLGIHLLLRG